MRPAPPRTGRPRSSVATLVGAVTAVVVASAAALPTAAATVSGAARSVGVDLVGRGFGHGIGMSQWGARGAADRGATWDKILAFYYPGTQIATGYAARVIRVNLSAMTGAPTRVRPAPGLLLDTGRCTQVLPAGSSITGWRVVRGSAGWQLEWSSPAGAWSGYASRCAVADAVTLTLRTTNHASTSAVTVVRPDGSSVAYRGWVSAVRSGGSVQTVNVVMLEHYLLSVVPSEMPPSWHTQALAAQSVAARSYAADRLGGSGSWDICDTTSCQVYSGRAAETGSVGTAVAATAGRVLTYDGQVATAMFSASNGGQVAPGAVPYLRAKPDPYESGYSTPDATWRVTVSTGTIESAFPSIGTFRELVIVRDGSGRWGGRARVVDLVGTDGTVSISGDRFRSVFGLRSTYVSPVGPSVGADLPGNGFPDVVGLDRSGSLWLYPGDGRGGWLSRRLLRDGLGESAQVLSPGDLDGDGASDVLVRTTSGQLVMHPGTPTGGLGVTRVVGTGWSTYSELVAPGDLDGDRRPDLLARDAAGVLWRYPGSGTGGWLARVRISAGWGSLRELEAVGDFSGDGGTDLVAVDRTGALRLYEFSATGRWMAVRPVGSGWSPFSRLTGPGDFDGDGALDLLARDATGALWLYRGSGVGGWRGRTQVGSGWSGFLDIAS
jgi:stage II sporulation protein D